MRWDFFAVEFFLSYHIIFYCGVINRNLEDIAERSFLHLSVGKNNIFYFYSHKQDLINSFIYLADVNELKAK
jgi:hypothetical protein